MKSSEKYIKSKVGLILLFAAGPGYSQGELNWTQTGPDIDFDFPDIQESIMAVDSLGGVYVASTYGIYVLREGAAAWDTVRATRNYVSRQFVNIEASGLLYSENVFSADGGNTWDTLPAPGPAGSGSVTAIVEAEGGGVLMGGYGDNIYRAYPSEGRYEYLIGNLSFTPIDNFYRLKDDIVVAVSLAQGMLISRDGGRQWAVHEDWDWWDEEAGYSNDALTADGAGNLYFTKGFAGLYVSADVGATMRHLGFQTLVRSVLPLSQEVILASLYDSAGGLYLTMDGGNNWERISTGLEEERVLCLKRHPGNRVAALTERGVFLSSPAPLDVYEGPNGRGRVEVLPGNGYFELRLSRNGKQSGRMGLYDARGHRLTGGFFKEGGMAFSVSDYGPGWYFLSVHWGETVFRERIWIP